MNDADFALQGQATAVLLRLAADDLEAVELDYPTAQSIEELIEVVGQVDAINGGLTRLLARVVNRRGEPE